MSQDTRLNNVEKALTPKQAVVHWLQEIEPFQNATEYVQYLRGRPESEAPITKLTDQIDKAVRKALR
jgi:hypothetical protein